MSIVQRVIALFVSPETLERMKAESNQWQIRCGTCGRAKPLWEAGGIRYGKRSTQTRSATLVRCRACGRLRVGVVERVP